MKEKFAIGISSEGQELNVARLRLSNHTTEIIELKSFTLKAPIDADLSPELPEQNFDDNSTQLFIEGELETQTAEIKVEDENEIIDDSGVYLDILRLSDQGSNHIALTLAEPQVYYHVFESNWGKKGKNTWSKIKSELALQSDKPQVFDKDNVGLVELSDNRLMGIVRGDSPSVLEQFERTANFTGNRLPPVQFTEGIELSLVNLFNDVYAPADDTFTLILHVGVDYSRLIFMKGDRLFHISQFISDGSRSRNILVILFSRLQFELDSLQAPKLDQIILTGMASSIGVKEYFHNFLDSDLKIEPLKNDALEVSALNPDLQDQIDKFAVPIGAALRSLRPQNKHYTEVDLTPRRIRERQNKLMISTTGWILLAIIPIIIVLSLVRINLSQIKISQLSRKIVPQKVEMFLKHELEATISKYEQLVNGITDETASIDSSQVFVNSEWSNLIDNLMQNSKRIGGIWFVEMSGSDKQKSTIKGYSINRHKIAILAESIGSSQLRMVEEREIRRQTVYYFEIEILTDNKKIE